MGNPVRFAVIGGGYIGKRHAEIIRRYQGCSLVAICDTDLSKHEGLKSLLGVPVFATAAEMLAAVPADVVNICTPNGLHAEHALLALEHNAHVVVEKPMALTKADCEKILYKALQVSKNVFCVMQNRYSPPSAWLKQVVSSGVLGNIEVVKINCFWNRDDRYYKPGGWKGTTDLDGGTLFTQFSHFVDIMYWVFGDITDIHARFENFTHRHSIAFEDTGLVSFRFLNGGLGTLSYSTSVWDTNFESSLTVIGSNGTIKVGGQYMDKVEYCNIHDYIMPELPPSNPPNDYGPYKGSAANHHYVIENVLDTLSGSGRITTNALEGLKVVEIIERMYALK